MVKQCIARNAALGRLKEDACVAAFESGPQSPSAQAAQLQSYVDKMEVGVSDQSCCRILPIIPDLASLRKACAGDCGRRGAQL